MTAPRKTYSGQLRPLFGIGLDGRIVVEWRAPDGETVWTETFSVLPGKRAYSQIQAAGEFRTTEGLIVDEADKRHFVMSAEGGILGAQP